MSDGGWTFDNLIGDDLFYFSLPGQKEEIFIKLMHPYQGMNAVRLKNSILVKVLDNQKVEFKCHGYEWNRGRGEANSSWYPGEICLECKQEMKENS